MIESYLCTSNGYGQQKKYQIAVETGNLVEVGSIGICSEKMQKKLCMRIWFMFD